MRSVGVDGEDTKRHLTPVGSRVADSADDLAAFLASQDYQLRIFADDERFLDRDRCGLLYSTDDVVIGSETRLSHSFDGR